MASVYDLKPKFQGLLRPMIGGLAKAGVTANHVTLLAMLGSIGIGVALMFAWREPWVILLLPLWLFVRMALNAIDGMMARELGMKSSLGGFLNEIGDVVSDTALYLPLALLVGDAAIPIVLFTIGAVLTEIAALTGQTLTGTRQNQGPMGKSDRALLVGAIAFFTYLFPAALVPRWPLVFAVAAFLELVTVVNRGRRSVR